MMEIMALSYDADYSAVFEGIENAQVAVTITGPQNRSWRGVRSGLDDAILLAGRILREQRAAAQKEALMFTISGAYVDSEQGGEYTITLLQDGKTIRQVRTASAPAAAAAAFLLEKNDDPAALVDSWRTDGTQSPADTVLIDGPVGGLTVGEKLIAHAEAEQGQNAHSPDANP